MNYVKKHGVEILNELNQENRIDYRQYSDMMDAVQEIELLRDRDEALEELWSQFGDVPMNPETECIEEPFMGWGVGIHREEIWHWFDKRHSKGVYWLLYGKTSWWLRAPISESKLPLYKTEADVGKELSALISRNAMCFDCDCEACGFNESETGLCRYPMVHGKKPTITEEDGCLDSAFA